MKWKRYRFCTHAVDDYRPLLFNPKYPWWCSGYGELSPLPDVDPEYLEYAVIVAYLPEDIDLYEYWDDAFDITFDIMDEIVFTTRFPKPDYFKES